MGAIHTSARTLFVLGAAGAALLAGSLGAHAADARPPGPGAPAAPITSFGFALSPSTVAPGGAVVLSVTGCNAASATVSSGVFDSVSIPRGRTARVTVDRDARRGAQYSVSFTCNGETGSAALTIAGGTTTLPTTASTAVARGVRGGLGGSVAGMDTTTIGAGIGLSLAGAAGLAFAARRRAARRH
ncbi:hypothetical protein ACN20G_01515 [Streptomyces sp. BI20]|uniref:hypothetical protein n=1 Tax=Streptomyces sp. BI20 TaxID=3403460 RepID=UPI003C74769A